MASKIEPRVLKGFRDILPHQEHERLRIMHLLQHAFEGFGFVPIDTPVLEYTDILLGKGGGETDQQVYRFEDQGGRDVAMRYDLTVPFARYMAAHASELYLPFKRFHMAKAWRGENTQRGRYREFMQCDFDIVGADSLGADFEILLLIDKAFGEMGVPGTEVHIAHRGVFNALLDELGVQQSGVEVLRAVDKLRKAGEDAVREMLAELIGPEKTSTVMKFITARGTNLEILEQMTRIVPSARSHLNRLGGLIEASEATGIAGRIILDPSITRGLDYYTGVVFETFLTELPEIGSVCSGGRYDNLTGLYSKLEMPGVGGSIGLDRLMAALEALGMADSGYSAADVLIACLDEALMAHYHVIGKELRTHRLRVEVFPEPKRIGQQFAFAEKKGIPVALICGEDERAAGTVNVRNMRTGANLAGLSLESALTAIREILDYGVAPTGRTS